MTPIQKRRFSFWEHNYPNVMVMLGRSDVGKNLDGFMVIVADMHDTIGKSLTETLSQVKGVNAQAHIEKVEKKGEIPTSIMILPVEAVARILAPVNPNVAKALRDNPTPSEGYLWVAIIAEEGTMLLQTSLEAAPAAGSS